MSKLDEKKKAFEDKLSGIQAQAQSQLLQDLARIEAAYRLGAEVPLPSPVQVEFRPSPAAQPLLDLTDYARLKELDAYFLEVFSVNRYYTENRFTFPTVYCETLEEFYSPLAAMELISESQREKLLKSLVEDARAAAEAGGIGTLGYILPGQGCFVNGWLFGFHSNLSARQAFDQPEIQQAIMATAAHEKLGHGFISMYTTLGQTKVQMGLDQVAAAEQFGLQTSDDPAVAVKRQQQGLIFHISRFLEEGWATWVENQIVRQQARYHREDLFRAIERLPQKPPELRELRQVLLQSYQILFGEQAVRTIDLHAAMEIFLYVDSTNLGQYFTETFGQPLPYVLGEMIFTHAVENQGWECAPFLTLIAANVSFDLTTIGLTDLATIVRNDPKFNPNSRLAALSRLRLTNKNSLEELVQRAMDELSYTVPEQLQHLYRE